MTENPQTPDLTITRISPELMEKEQRGEVLFVGCVIEPDQPTWQCLRCGAEFY
jgi:hypothetical protein